MLDEDVRDRVEVMAVSVDGPEDQRRMIERILAQGGEAPTFRLLTDGDAAVIRRYGIFNAEDHRGRAIPHPTTLVIDESGVVRWKVVETDYTLRPTNADIAAALSAVAAGEDPGPAQAAPVDPAR